MMLRIEIDLSPIRLDEIDNEDKKYALLAVTDMQLPNRTKLRAYKLLPTETSEVALKLEYNDVNRRTLIAEPQIPDPVTLTREPTCITLKLLPQYASP